MIAIIDYGVGNPGSIQNMFQYLGIASHITSSAEEIRAADKLLLPGVGAFDAGMKHLHESGLKVILDQEVLDKGKPILGICLGMQMMTNGSEEGMLPGLMWIEAETMKFKTDAHSVLRIPHMGWNQIEINQEHPLLTGLEGENKFYFVHSFFVKVAEESDCAAKTLYGTEFTSVFARDNIMGVQFHPEKSHRYGMQVLKNFANL